MKRLLSILIVACLLFGYIPCIASASETTVSSASEFNKAIINIEDGGTIRVSGSVNLTSWPSADKAVTVTGGTLTFSDLGIGCDVTFRDITLTGTTLYANGNRLYIDGGVTASSGLTVYGGSNGVSVNGTDLTVLSGTYKAIYGGSNGGTVDGNTNLTVGGTANSGADPTKHEAENCVYGGSNNGTITGSANLVFTGSAQANYVYGGSSGSSQINKGTNFLFSGGKVMSIYGGSKNADHHGNVNLTITGGEAEQVFGGNEGSSLTGNVNVNLLGGTITRRVYGGCYNEVSDTGEWQSTNYVTGNIFLTIGGVSIDFSSSSKDRSIYGHSRQGTLSSSENSHIIFTDATAYNKYKSKLGARDWAMGLIMFGVSAADYTHYFTYSTSGASITQSCSYHKDVTATATLSASDSTYTEKEIKTATVSLSNTWIGDAPAITYANNINAGTATASITVGGATASTTFKIGNASQSAPPVSGVPETIKGKKDGKINGLTTDMEVSTNGTSYTAVTDENMTFAPGTYYVRYAAKTNHNASDPTTVTIDESTKLLTITFKAEGSDDVVIKVEWNGTLTDIPSVPTRNGYTANGWIVNGKELTANSIKNIQQDMVISANYAIKTYTVKFIADGKVVSEQVVAHGDSAVVPEIPEKPNYNAYWKSKGENITADTTIIADYELKKYSVEYFVEGTRVRSEVVEHGKNAPQPNIEKQKTGHTAAWDHDGKNITENTVITAVYTPKTYKVTYIADGKTIDTQNVKYNQNASAPAVPQKNGYTAMWDKDGKNITADTTITAIYVSVNAGKYIDATPKDNYGSGALTQSAEQLRLTVPMTKTEQAAVDNGEDVTLRFTVTDAASSVSAADKKAIDSAVKDGISGAYLDLAMFKQVGTNKEAAVSTLNSEVTVTLSLPQSLINTDTSVDRTYKLIRVENGKATVVSHIFEDGIIRFSTSKFGTYAIVFVDTQIVEVAPPVIEVPTTPVEDPTEATTSTDATTPDGTQSTAPSATGSEGNATGNTTGNATDSSVPATTEPVQNDSQNSPVPGILIAVAVILVLAGGGCGGWFWYQKKKKSQE